MSRFNALGFDMLAAGPVIFRTEDGRYTNRRGGIDEDAVPARAAFACRHKRLRGEERCCGCGRTMNEIRVDEGR